VKRIFLLLILPVVCFIPLLSSSALSITPVVSYNIDVRFFPDEQKLVGSEQLTWTNRSTKPVRTLRFHLYYNAFRNEHSTFLQETGFYRKSAAELEEYRFGEIRVTEIGIIGGERLTDRIRFIAPDDGNEHDRTVMEVRLNRPVSPNQSIRLQIDFILNTCEIFSRTGQAGDYVFMGQWFPKIGVLERNGQWHCHQFHRSTEFFSDFGEYRVGITVPKHFVVGATGNMINSRSNDDGTVTYAFHEKDIHDFAWTAYPDFVRITETVRLPGNERDTIIELLLCRQHAAVKERYLKSLIYTLNFFAENIFPYPHRKITLVDTPYKGFNSSGMEYPTLFTAGCGYFYYPEAVKALEMLTIHEFGHEYWYGMIATDEFREPWLDEGVNTFFELELMEQYFKGKGSILDCDAVRVQNWERRRGAYVSSLPVDRVNAYSWHFVSHQNYRGHVYSKGALFLMSMKNLVGYERMFRFFRVYGQRYRLKHPTTEDFIKTFQEVMGADYSWAFEQFINGDVVLDHAVHSVESVAVEGESARFRNEVVLLRQGYFPAEVLIRLTDGRSIRKLWKEQERWKKIIFYESAPIKYATIDPDFKVPLDKNFLNNSKMLSADLSDWGCFAKRLGSLFQTLVNFFVF